MIASGYGEIRFVIFRKSQVYRREERPLAFRLSGTEGRVGVQTKGEQALGGMITLRSRDAIVLRSPLTALPSTGSARNAPGSHHREVVSSETPCSRGEQRQGSCLQATGPSQAFEKSAGSRADCGGMHAYMRTVDTHASLHTTNNTSCTKVESESCYSRKKSLHASKVIFQQ
jgi:hypothetical protein